MYLATEVGVGGEHELGDGDAGVFAVFEVFQSDLFAL